MAQEDNHKYSPRIQNPSVTKQSSKPVPIWSIPNPGSKGALVRPKSQNVTKQLIQTITKEDVQKMVVDIVKQIQEPFAVATYQAKLKFGEDADFSPGAPAQKYRDRIAETLKEK